MEVNVESRKKASSDWLDFSYWIVYIIKTKIKLKGNFDRTLANSLRAATESMDSDVNPEDDEVIHISTSSYPVS
jgi:hypothetical protein